MTTSSHDEGFFDYLHIALLLLRSAGPQRRRRHRGHGRSIGRSIDTARPVSSSQSSSSLSSPNETCYSFVRRALQKLAGGKRSAPWFLDSWAASAAGSPGAGLRDMPGPRRHEPEGCEDSDIQDLPIELRRLEEDLEPPQVSEARVHWQNVTRLLYFQGTSQAGPGSEAPLRHCGGGNDPRDGRAE